MVSLVNANRGGRSNAVLSKLRKLPYAPAKAIIDASGGGLFDDSHGAMDYIGYINYNGHAVIGSWEWLDVTPRFKAPIHWAIAA